MKRKLDNLGEFLVEVFLRYGWFLVIVVTGVGIFMAVGPIDSSSDEVDTAMSKAKNITDSDFCERTSPEYVGTPRINCYQNRTLQNTTVYTNQVTFDVLLEKEGFKLRVVR